MGAEAPDISIVPANRATCEDLLTIFGTRGTGYRCQCQRYKLQPRESFGSFPVEERAFRLREQTDCGYPDSNTTSGLRHGAPAPRLSNCDQKCPTAPEAPDRP